MIYLIGGPPKCGKTTLSKKLSRELGIPWISADTLTVIIREHLTAKEMAKKFPWSLIRKKTKRSNDVAYATYSAKEVVKAYRVQASSTAKAIDMFSICEIEDKHDYIVEGYQVTPELASRLMKKYGVHNFKAVFLVRKDSDKLVVDFKKSTTHNDWILTNTKNEETYGKIAKMISEYGNYFEKESEKHGYKVFNMDEDFNKQLEGIGKYLKS